MCVCECSNVVSMSLLCPLSLVLLSVRLRYRFACVCKKNVFLPRPLLIKTFDKKNYLKYLRFGFTQVDVIKSGTTTHVVCPTQTTPADILASLGAKALAGMLLTTKAGIFRLQHQESYKAGHTMRPEQNGHRSADDTFKCLLKIVQWNLSITTT